MIFKKHVRRMLLLPCLWEGRISSRYHPFRLLEIRVFLFGRRFSLYSYGLGAFQAVSPALHLVTHFLRQTAGLEQLSKSLGGFSCQCLVETALKYLLSVFYCISLLFSTMMIVTYLNLAISIFTLCIQLFFVFL